MDIRPRLKHILKKKIRAFTLLELITTLVVVLIIMGTFALLLKYSFDQMETTVKKETGLEDISYAFYMMDREILAADKIYPASDFDLWEAYPNSLGFVLYLEENGTNTYCYYAFRDNTLYRIAKTLPKLSTFSIKSFNKDGQNGANIICTNIASVEGSSYNPENSLVNLAITYGKDGVSKEFKTAIFKEGTNE